jgi:hypothetical protein
VSDGTHTQAIGVAAAGRQRAAGKVGAPHRAVKRWAVQWNSKNLLDGPCQYFMRKGVEPVLFRTRQEARRFITEKFGYIAARADLQSEPHCWQMPRAVKVVVELRADK